MRARCDPHFTEYLLYTGNGTEEGFFRLLKAMWKEDLTSMEEGPCDKHNLIPNASAKTST